MSTIVICSCTNNTLKNDPNIAKHSKDITTKETELDSASIIFNEENHDFGKLRQGEKVFYSFKFKNNGNAALVISGARGSCGCTVPTYPKQPIMPEKEGSIDVVFDSENLSGIMQKTITINTNCKPNGVKILTISCNVLPNNL